MRLGTGLHRVRIVLLALLTLSAAACGTLEVGIAGTPGPSTETALVETRVVIPATPQGTAAEATTAPSAQAPTPTPVPAPANLYVAFSRDNNVWLWAEGGEAVQLTRRGGVDQIRISDDGAIIAFSRGGELWMVRADGSDERPLVSIDDLAAIRDVESTESELVLHRFEWIPWTHHVAFNTRLDIDVGVILSDDLWQVNAEPGEKAAVLPPGDGGEFYYSPDGRQVAVATPGSVVLFDSGGGNRREALTYTPVATASEFRYYARPVWAADSGSLRIVIPPANPYAQPPQLATVWRLATEGTSPRLLGDIPSSAMSQPAFSSDLRYVAHQAAEQVGAAENRTSLLITDLDLRGTVTYYPESDAGVQITLDSGDVITHHPQVGQIYGWAPQGQHFAFATQPDPELGFQAQIGQLGGDVVLAFPDAAAAVIDLQWVDADRYLFVAQGARGWDILLGSVGGEIVPVATVGGAGPPPSYDFAAPPTVPEPSEAATVVDLPEGLVFQTADGLWRVDGAGQPQLIFDRGAVALSPDGTRVLYDDPDDVWLADLTTGERRNVTGTSARTECCAQWWPAQPETILFSSWTPEEVGPSYGFPTLARLEGTGYTIVDDAEVSYSLPAPSPDGQTVAYDRAGKAWLYGRKTGPEPFDPSAYGVPVAYGSQGEAQWRIVSPAWSPHGDQLAWVVADCREGPCETSIGVFDLEEQTARLLHPYAPMGRGGQPPAPLWSPDGQWLAFVVEAEMVDEAGLWVFRADGQSEYPLATGDVGTNPTPVWSPDGRWLAYSSTSSDGEIRWFWLAEAGTWELSALELPPDAHLIAWVGI